MLPIEIYCKYNNLYSYNIYFLVLKYIESIHHKKGMLILQSFPLSSHFSSGVLNKETFDSHWCEERPKVFFFFFGNPLKKEKEEHPKYHPNWDSIVGQLASLSQKLTFNTSTPRILLSGPTPHMYTILVLFASSLPRDDYQPSFFQVYYCPSSFRKLNDLLKDHRPSSHQKSTSCGIVLHPSPRMMVNDSNSFFQPSCQYNRFKINILS